MSTPLFSLIIPTRCRARYLQYALASCLGQTYDDLEIVISDNNSTDNTKELSLSHNDPRIKYVNTGTDLSVTDNFEYGFSNASGEYLFFLADDEAIKPNALAKLKKLLDATQADVVSFGRTTYVFPEVEADGSGNYLVLRPFTRNLVRLPSSLGLSYVSTMKLFKDYYYARMLPLSVKSIVKRSLAVDIAKHAGVFQLPPTPDWSSCAMILACVDSLVLLDEHLNIAGKVRESSGPNFKTKRTIPPGSEAEVGHSMNFTPVGCHTLFNVALNAFVRGQKAISPKLDNFALDNSLYTKLILEELVIQEKHGIDIAPDLEEIRRVGAELKLDLKKLFEEFETTRSAGPAKPANSLWPVRLTGEEHGFSNILECAQRFDALTESYGTDTESAEMFKNAYGSGELLDVDLSD